MLARVDIRHAPAYQVCSWLWYAGLRSLLRFHIGGTMSISSVTVSSLWKTWNAYSDILYHAKALNFLILRVTPSCSLEHFFREPCCSFVWSFIFIFAESLASPWFDFLLFYLYLFFAESHATPLFDLYRHCSCRSWTWATVRYNINIIIF